MRLFCNRVSCGRDIYLRFPDLRDSDASTLRTSDWEIPNCLAIRVGVIPALKVARTALTWPGVNATFGSSGCRRAILPLLLIDPRRAALCPYGLSIEVLAYLWATCRVVAAHGGEPQKAGPAPRHPIA